MASLLLTEDRQFIVGENKGLNYTIAIIFFVIAIAGFVEGSSNSFLGVAYVYVIIVLFILPGIYYFRKAKSSRIYIRINNKGIFQNEILVTNWDNFLKAKVTQKDAFFSIQDDFLLLIEYFKDDSDKGFRRRIPLGNTQNKSEEEVMEAIKYFWQEHHGLLIEQSF